MVERNSQEAQFGNVGTVQAQQSQEGMKQADPNMYRKSESVSAGIQAETSGDRILNGIMGTAGKLVDDLGNKLMAKTHEEAYLAGQAAATTGKNEADLQTDIFTKDWATAGFRDTMGRIAMSDNASRIQEDMPKLREMPPEKFAEYMNERRANLMPSLDGMSLQARKAVFSSMALDERTQFHVHAAEHRKFVWEQQQASIQSSFGSSLRALDAAATVESPGSDSTAAYSAATSGTLATLHQLTVANPNVPIAARSNLIFEAAKNALASNHQQLYEKMKTQPMPDGNGGFTTMLDQLTSNDRAKLEGSYRESLGRTAGARNLNTMLEFSTMQAQWNDDNTPLQPSEEVRAKIEAAFTQGAFGPTDDPSKGAAEKAASLWKDYSSAALKKKGRFESANAWFTGDVGAVVKAGRTATEAMDSWQSTVGRNMPLAENIATLTSVALRNGQYEGLDLAGKLSKPAWARLMTNPDIDPASAKIVANSLAALESSKDKHPGAMQAYLSSFDPETREMILLVQGNLSQNPNPTEAVMMAQATMLKNSKADPSARAARAALTAKENAEIVADTTSSNMLGQAWSAAKSVFSSKAANKADQEVSRSFFENPARVAEAQGVVNMELEHELINVTRDHPYADKGVREQLARAALGQRLAITKGGVVVAPQGQTLESYFGIKDKERVGQVLSDMIPPTQSGNRVVFDASGVNGELLFKEFNAQGQQTRVGHIDPKSVKAAAEHKREQEVADINIVQGVGKTVNVNGIPINYNGSNSLGINPQDMFDFRSRLIKHEGATDTPKDDVGGMKNSKTGKTVQTGGVGISDTNDFYPKLAPGQKMTPQQINAALRDSSEAAARIAQHWQSATKTQGNGPLFQLFAELAFQGGGGGTKYTKLLEAVQARNYYGAMTALRGTPAWNMAGDGPRRKFYEDSLTKALKD